MKSIPSATSSLCAVAVVSIPQPCPSLFRLSVITYLIKPVVVAEKAGISQSTVSRNYKELQREQKLLDEEAGSRLRLAPGVTPRAWSKEGVMEGFPTPERFAEVWEAEVSKLEDDDPDNGGDGGGGGEAPPSTPSGGSGGGEECPPDPGHIAHKMQEDIDNGHNPDKTAESLQEDPAYG